METKDARSMLICGSLLRLGTFVGFIEEAIGRRAVKNICTSINKAVEGGCAEVDFLYMTVSRVLREVKQSNYLMDKLIEFGDREVLFIVLDVSLAHELADKKSFWRRRHLSFRDEEKARLIDFLVSAENKISIFGDVRKLLYFARAIPYDSQALLYRTYLETYDEFVTSADFLEVYEMWDGLSPDIRESLRQFIKGALARFRFRLLKTEKHGGIEVIDASKK